MAAITSTRTQVRLTKRLREKQHTLPKEKVSLVLHEPGVLTGYRPPYQSWSYYVKSIFQIHNETGNIWTHIIGSLIIIQQVYTYVTLYDLAGTKLSVTVLGAGYSFFLTVGVSVIVHILHSRSAYHHFILFMTDYLSAAFCLYGTGLLSMYGYSDPDFYATFGDWYLLAQAVSMYCVFVLVCISKLWYGNDPHDMRRKYMLLSCFTVHALLDCAPFIPRIVKCYSSDNCSMSSLNHLAVIVVLTVLQAVVYGSHQPEKTWPGKFDIVGHSHQLFHVITTVSHVTQFHALHLDFQNGLTSHCQPDAYRVLGVTALVSIAELITLKYLVSYVPVALGMKMKRR